MNGILRTMPAMAAALALAAPALAFDPANMTDAERKAFHAEIRAYILANPDVIGEAVSGFAGLSEDQFDAAVIRANAQELFADGNSWIGGPEDGDQYLVEFVDYRCGFCRRADPVVRELMRETPGLRVVMKEYPILGEQSMISSRFAIATKLLFGDDAYRAVHDALISYGGQVNDAALSKLAELLKLDGKAIIAHMNSPAVNGVISANRALATRLRLTGTPGFVTTSAILRGFMPIEGMREQLRLAKEGA